jgi:hypothetical protein
VLIIQLAGFTEQPRSIDASFPRDHVTASWKDAFIAPVLTLSFRDVPPLRLEVRGPWQSQGQEVVDALRETSAQGRKGDG